MFLQWWSLHSTRYGMRYLSHINRYYILIHNNIRENQLYTHSKRSLMRIRKVIEVTLLYTTTFEKTSFILSVISYSNSNHLKQKQHGTWTPAISSNTIHSKSKLAKTWIYKTTWPRVLEKIKFAKVVII